MQSAPVRFFTKGYSMKNLLLVAALFGTLQVSAQDQKIDTKEFTKNIYSCQYGKVENENAPIKGYAVQILTNEDGSKTLAMFYPICPVCRILPRYTLAKVERDGASLVYRTQDNDQIIIGVGIAPTRPTNTFPASFVNNKGVTQSGSCTRTGFAGR